MNNSIIKKPLVFLLGAGFNVDAASEAGNRRASSPNQPVRYPLVCELLDICFGMHTLPSDRSIEDLFQDSIDRGRWKPVETLYNLLMEADYSITHCLKRGESHENNAYLKFLRDFPDAPLLTFNYDSLPEILLLGERSWRPEDGYGIRVHAKLELVQDKSLVAVSSLRHILHLHGTLCVYAATFHIKRCPGSELSMLQFKSQPDFIFDPDSLARSFFPFARILPGENYTHLVYRVIAPVPNKAEGLKGEFIRAVYSRAKDFVSRASQIVAIGYSFNQNDRVSYSPLLAAAKGRSVLLVAPNAGALIERLAREYPDIRWEAESLSFKTWVSNDYPKLQKDQGSSNQPFATDM